MLSVADDTRSFERVYRDQFDFAWRTLRALGVPEGAVDDALQDLFIVVHRRLQEFEGRASVRTWIYEIARRVALRYRSRAVREASRQAELTELPARVDLDAALDQAMASRVMQDFLWTLDDDRRRAFVLAEFGGMAGREIAEALDVNMNTIYARIRSARTELDRLAKRLCARDATAVTRALRSSPPEAARRQAWIGVLAVVGRPSGLLAGLGLGKAALAWAAGGLAVVGVATVLTTRDTPPPAVPVPEAPAPAAVGDVVASRPPAPAAEPLVPPAPPSPAATPPARAPTPRARKARETPSLTDELALVQRLRAAVRSGGRAEAETLIASYRDRHADGTLQVEVDGLEVELACRTHAADATEQLERFSRTDPDPPLLARLQAICTEFAPQDAKPSDTQGP